MDYLGTKNFIEAHYGGRFFMHKVTQSIYFDGESFNIIKFRELACREKNVVLSEDKFIEEIAYLCASRNMFSPIEDYLKQCQEKHPIVLDNDALQTLDKVCTNILHVSDPLEKVYIIKTLVAAVKRVYQPGCQHDTVLILRSDEQGLYKTSFFTELAGAEFFTSLTLTQYDKDELMICHSKWMIELEECEGTIKPHMMSKLKGFITRRFDSYRRPYSKNSCTVHRQFILVGTTNQSKFLQDETGNRRFWVVNIDRKIDIKAVRKYRDLIWSAAIFLYRNDYPTYLSEAEQALSNKVNAEKFKQADVWTELVTTWVSKQTGNFTLSDVLIKAIGKEAKSWVRSDETRVKAILLGLGFKHPEKTTRVDSRPGKYYNPADISMNSSSRVSG
ncbi:VapE domain-containing protein [Leptolyngbya sp. FACHB-17]|uniref:VapE domain-containing protein n=1 Tax=unclassified Leptolyngbya TaxID=2650499 RepID=UPI001681B1E4|nr:VapE domain-containing protein [Leptolyngbya sp. FACHB-17]MBD2078392.1 hypothetical protein [Leptolyngbya sp. FACHB-17]